MILLGVQAYSAPGDAGARQLEAQNSLRQLSGVCRLNVQFKDDAMPCAVEGFETVPVLERDSRTATGAPGRRKPLIGEVCASLAREAQLRGAAYFCFTNSDIVFTQDAIDVMVAEGRDGYAFSRMDVDPVSGRDIGINLGGVDAIAARPAWWLEHRSRFRDFIVGEANWDQLYTSILLRHADAVLFNARPLIRHRDHPKAWSEVGPFANYNGYLGALDSPYFSLWCEYHARREAWAASGGTEQEHIAFQREIFKRPWHLSTRLTQPLRRARAWLRYTAR